MPAKIIFDDKQIYDLFVTQGLTRIKIAKILNVSRRSVGEYINSKGWIQSDEAIKKNSARPNKFKVELDKDVLIQLYINQNLSKKEVADKMGVNESSVVKRIAEYGIVKSNEARIECAKRKFIEEHPLGWSDPEIRKKIEATCELKYGVKHPSQNPDVRAKARATCLKNYGVEYSLQSKEVRDKGRDNRRKALFLNNGNTNIDEAIRVTANRDVFREFIKENNFKTCRQISDRLQISMVTIERLVTEFFCWDIVTRFKSQPEIELGQFLESIGVKCKSRKDIMFPYEIDLYDEETKIGVEFNGTYWHCDLVKKQDYHQKKSLAAEAAGVKLIHIYEYEWKDERIRPIIQSMLRIAFGKVSNRIYARNCDIRQISNKEAKPFNEANHLQGHKNAQLTYGLFYQNQLVQLMSFSYNKKQNWWEIERGCPGSNNIVVGGVSKLFKHFIEEKNPEKVFSYCDYNKFDGSGYEKIGMKFIGLTKPDMKWVINGEVYNRNPSRHEEFKKNSEARIFGAGSKKYLWQK